MARSFPLRDEWLLPVQDAVTQVPLRGLRLKASGFARGTLLALLVVVQQAEDIVLGEAVAATEEVQFHGEG